MEWRTKGETDDAIVLIDPDQNTVRNAVEADPALLRDFLNDMENLDARLKTVKDAQRDPDTWGKLVMARATTGEILDMDPERFWDGIYFWFRSRGLDPHHMKARR
jgi:hypothetical protein